MYFILFYFILQINTRVGPSLSAQPPTNLARLFPFSGAQPHNQAGPSLKNIFRHTHATVSGASHPCQTVTDLSDPHLRVAAD